MSSYSEVESTAVNDHPFFCSTNFISMSMYLCSRFFNYCLRFSLYSSPASFNSIWLSFMFSSRCLQYNSCIVWNMIISILIFSQYSIENFCFTCIFSLILHITKRWSLSMFAEVRVSTSFIWVKCIALFVMISRGELLCSSTLFIRVHYWSRIGVYIVLEAVIQTL